MKEYAILCKNKKELEEISKKARKLKYEKIECSSSIAGHIKNKRTLVIYLENDGHWEYNVYPSIENAQENNSNLITISDLLKEIDPDDFIEEINRVLEKYE